MTLTVFPRERIDVRRRMKIKYIYQHFNVAMFKGPGMIWVVSLVPIQIYLKLQGS